MVASDMKEIMDYLGDAEGLDVHYLSNEKDFTTPYGVYAYAHPTAKVVLRIREIAKANGIYKNSKDWDSSDVAKVNSIVKTKYKEEILGLATDFYIDFTKSVHLEYFPKLARVAMYSMYANSPKRAWMSVQQSLLDMSASKAFNFKNPLSIVDGDYGSKTGNALKEFTDYLEFQDGSDKYGNLYFEALLLSNMKTQYIRMAIANPTEFLQYLKGWANRMDNLQRLR